MASDGLGVSSVPPEDQRDEGTHLTDTPTPEAEAGVPSEPQCDKDTLKPTAESAERDEKGVDVCRFFLMGKCHFGHRCRFSHSNPSVDDSVAVSPDQDDKQDGEKTEKYKKKVNKAAKPKYEAKEVYKKPRMRTADDVISRILWDPPVDGSEFVVGYVDRFLGVLERPFNEFNWDTDPCDCDYTSELALPRHRIQYFTYRGHRVWDRHSRTDRVFGSTGQSLAPPFGGEEEVKEMNTEEQQQDGLKTTEEQPPAVSLHLQEESAHTESTHLEEEKQSEMNTHTPDSTPPAPECQGNISQEQQESRGTCVVEEAATRPEASTDQMSSSQKDGASVEEEVEEENLAECQESWEGNEDASSDLGALNISQKPSAPLEQREERRGGVRPAKKRPTHFITFKANTPAILSSFQQLQEEISALLPSSAPHWQTAASLHITMCLLNLSGPAEVAAAGEILRRFAHLDRNPPVALTFPVKLKHFNGKVLYLSPQAQIHLQELNCVLQEAYMKEGWLHKDSYNPRYHLTLAKVEGNEGNRIFEGVGDLKVGKGLNFGRLPVNTLHLCAMGGSKVDGFFETLCTVSLR
ncbi:leukocyte receptor cluster member 9 isoform X1 [Sebastes umbrosus]|uniref:leukocyte receptor cluster member 9 isoform X1 n=1 Tax=Sebastes umbrosus TaxID=72105 RepID=UPI0018A011BA|nr:leukocyte receptor cluster member 9 isoform X1 [Sebastes umbrosus]XP_037640833.1 leukocyte receptor cluster member 9 isoform X1 [Sebastes umbrosus]XP_037640834.1 leukocyte receptor cluster member 9 isoform X1 [Sebastes umbrosus]